MPITGQAAGADRRSQVIVRPAAYLGAIAFFCALFIVGFWVHVSIRLFSTAPLHPGLPEALGPIYIGAVLLAVPFSLGLAANGVAASALLVGCLDQRKSRSRDPGIQEGLARFARGGRKLVVPAVLFMLMLMVVPGGADLPGTLWSWGLGYLAVLAPLHLWGQEAGPGLASSFVLPVLMAAAASAGIWWQVVGFYQLPLSMVGTASPATLLLDSGSRMFLLGFPVAIGSALCLLGLHLRFGVVNRADVVQLPSETQASGTDGEAPPPGTAEFEVNHVDSG